MTPELQVGLLAAVAALGGSIVGGIITFLTTYYAEKKRFEHELSLRDIEKRETLYSDFIGECTRVILAALDNKKGSALDFSTLFSLTGRIRVVAPEEIGDAAAAFGSLAIKTPGPEAEEEKRKKHQADVKPARKKFTELCQKEIGDMKKRA